MERCRLDGRGHPIVLLGTCEGLESEHQAVRDAIGELAPSTVALALEPDLVAHLSTWEESDELGPEDQAYAKGLGAWGPVSLPPPEYGAAAEAAEATGAQTVGVDLAEGHYLDLYTDGVSTWELLKRAWRIRRLDKKPPKTETPEAFCRAVDERLNAGPFAELEAAREQAMAEAAGALSEEGTVVLVLPVQRLDGVRRALETASRAPASAP